MTTLTEALDQSYRGILNGADLATAHLGDQEKQWAEPVEVARNLFTNPNLVGDGTWAEVARFTTGDTPPEMVQPEDFRIRDLGTGESVMEIERVRGLTTTRCIAGVSTKGGKPAVRMIPTDAANPLSYFNFAMPVAAQSGGTLLGTAHIDAPLTGVLDSSTKRIRSYFPIEVSEVAPNIAGSYPQRLVYSSRTTGAIIQYWHGGTQGSGDVWWTDIGLFAGNYTGETFSVDSSPDPDTIAEWAGPRNASESILWGWPE